MKKRGTAGLLGGALAVVLLAGNVLGGSYPAYAQDTPVSYTHLTLPTT